MNLALSPFSRTVQAEFTDPWGLYDPWIADLRHVRSGLIPAVPGDTLSQLADGRPPKHCSDALGYSLWAGPGLGVEVWFEWFEMDHNVLAIRRPMDIQANVLFIDRDGKPASRPIVTTFLKTVVGELDWHDQALECLTAQRRNRQGSGVRPYPASMTH